MIKVPTLETELQAVNALLEASDKFYASGIGDFNTDGKTDLIVRLVLSSLSAGDTSLENSAVGKRFTLLVEVSGQKSWTHLALWEWVIKINTEINKTGWIFNASQSGFDSVGGDNIPSITSEFVRLATDY